MTSSIRCSRPCGSLFALGLTARRGRASASAQLDPLLFLKTVQPNVLVVVDTSQRMQRDSDEVYYDPRDYTRRSRPCEPALGVTAGQHATQYYRRKYLDLAPVRRQRHAVRRALRFRASATSRRVYADFYARTRLGVARPACARPSRRTRRWPASRS